MKRYGQEISVAIAIAALAVVLAFVAPAYFSGENLSDLFLSNMPVLVVAIGMTLVILTAEIDVSVGSIFAICGVSAGVIAKEGVPVLVACLAACAIGAALGALNGALVAYVRIPSIVVTLATMTALRDGLRWATQGAWVENLPTGFQWFGLTQSSYPVAALVTAVVLVGAVGWGLRNLAAGRAIYAAGSNAEAARVSGINTRRVVFLVFVATGALTGLAAVFNSVRFNQIPSNAGLGLELKVIAAVVVGGTAITGGRGSIAGTVLGVVLLGAIGPALIFLGTSAYWELALQGVVILAAITIEALRSRAEMRHASLAAHRI
ncbi:MAG TPA: ABC transporter permease [Candidatus Acidoferrales bacterium]|nr:ABC transporter permease [Candidatus Acidoferrales bacterium]